MATSSGSKPTDSASAEARWWVYMLRCAGDTLYTGITNDLERRVARHNAGRAAAYTRSHLPVELVYCEPAADRGAALSREAALKKLPRARKLELVALASVEEVAAGAGAAKAGAEQDLGDSSRARRVAARGGGLRVPAQTSVSAGARSAAKRKSAPARKASREKPPRAGGSAVPVDSRPKRGSKADRAPRKSAR